MDKKEKKSKKGVISAFIDLGSGRYKDEEVETLFDLVNNRKKYDGTSRTYTGSHTGWSSDGKYTRDSETTYIFRGKEHGVSVEENYSYHDDDGQSGSYNRVYSTAREVLPLLKKLFDK